MMSIGLHAIGKAAADNIFSKRKVLEKAEVKEIARHIWESCNHEKYDDLFWECVFDRLELNAAIVEKSVPELITLILDSIKSTLEVKREEDERKAKEVKDIKKQLKEKNEELEESNRKVVRLQRELDQLRREMNNLRRSNYERSRSRSRSRSRGRGRRR